MKGNRRAWIEHSTALDDGSAAADFARGAGARARQRVVLLLSADGDFVLLLTVELG